MKKNIIIDCDPGQDDAVAIALAHSSEYINLLGLTTVAGNNTLYNIIKNSKLILQLLKSKAKLYKGSPVSLLNNIYPQNVHGFFGMEGLKDKHQIYYKVEKKHYIDFFKEQLSNKKVTVIAIGPLTNIALIIKILPEYLKNIVEIVIMGGGLGMGNITTHAEFNLFVDPEAAKIVFNSDIPITLFPLNLTNKGYLLKSEYSLLKNGGLLAKSLYELISYYHESGREEGFEMCCLHDVNPIIYLLDEDIFTFENTNIDVVLDGQARGMTFINEPIKNISKNNVKLATEINRFKFSELLVNNILKLDRKLYG